MIIFKQCVSDIEESFFEDDEKELDTPSADKQSVVEIEINSKEEISPFLLIDTKNEKRKDVIVGNIKKNQNYSAQPNETNSITCASKLSNKMVNQENSELEFDKLEKFNFYYPDFNFENVIKRLLPKKKSRKGYSIEKKKNRSII